MLIAVVLGALAVVWALADLSIERIGFAATVPPKLRGAEEAASALARIFGALVLSLYPPDATGRRLHWVAAGFVVMGVGHLFYGYMAPLLGFPADPDTGLFAGFVVRTLAAVLFVIGLVPDSAPRFSRRVALAVAVGTCAAWAVVELAEGIIGLPRMIAVESIQGSASVRAGGMVPGLTGWHWVLSAVPLILTIAATAGAFRGVRRGRLRGWLLVAMTLLAASQLHHALWPSVYGSPLLTSADLLRLTFAAVVAIGGVLELRRIANDRAHLLTKERERTQALEELASMKADFTSMVAHELSSPLLAIRGLAEMFGSEGLEPSERARILGKHREQADSLEALIEDVRASADVERDDFALAPRPTLANALLADAASYAGTMPGGHRLVVSDATEDAWVLADPERIGQVLRNLLANAAKYSLADSEIELRAEPVERTGRVRISVRDRGFGIRAEDLGRIFEKFGRGRDLEGRKVPGAGLGLYVSRRIVCAHGSELAVWSAPGEGSVFSFELEVDSGTDGPTRR